MPETAQHILPKDVTSELRTSYLDYSMSVLVGRALPDVRDGLKPVHRRVLYTMYQSGLLHTKPYRKSANVVGTCMARYHPHGDLAIYDTLVRMAQDFSLRYPLVDGQGNFGSVDGDNAAAMRYTEARLARIASELLADIEKQTVPFAPNFDGSAQEPTVLPTRIPNLLINGSSGIAVGMATNIPPHNLREVSAACIHLLRNPSAGVNELLPLVTGPDFPTGGIIIGTRGIHESYMRGRGSLRVRARMTTETVKDRARIIVTELPFQLNKAQLIEEIAGMVRDKRIDGIADIRDESDREGMRIVFDLRKDASAPVVENQLLSRTRLESTFGVSLVALVNNQPRTVTLLEMLSAFIEHRRSVIKARTQFDLTKAQERLHILDGLLAALERLDFVIEGIRKSADSAAAKAMLVRELSLSELQAQAILDLRLHRLASLERAKIRDEHTQTRATIAELQSILASEQKVSGIIESELSEISATYGDERRTEIRPGEDDDVIVEEDLIREEQMIVTITHAGYVKRIAADTYRAQNRGGKGIIAAETREADFVAHAFAASTHAFLLFFTNAGIVHWLKVYQIPEAGRQAMGKALVNLLQLPQGHRVTACIPIQHFSEKDFLLFATTHGVIKKTPLTDYSRPRRGGIIAIGLDESDQLISVRRTDGTRNIIIATKQGRAARFTEADVRPAGRGARGVRGIKLRSGDSVIGMVATDEEHQLLSVTEGGIGKRTPISDYRFTNRGSKGVINIKTGEKSGGVVSICEVTDATEVLLVSKLGQAIRTPVAGISQMGRNTKGVRLMRLDAGDSVVGLAPLSEETTE